MASHSDRDSDDMLARIFRDTIVDNAPNVAELFRQRAEAMTLERSNEITAGKPGERILLDVDLAGFHVRRLEDDDLALRISIGEAHSKSIGKSAYLVFRGDPAAVEHLLARALDSIRARKP